MKTIIFIGTQKSGSSREAIGIAEQLGYYTALLTDRLSFIEKRTEFPDVHLMQLCNLHSYCEIKSIIDRLMQKGLEISAIVSFVDGHCHMACQLAEEYKVSITSTQAVRNMENKVASRQILCQLSYTPNFVVLHDEFLLEYVQDRIKTGFPFIMKDPCSAGSKDVFLIHNEEEFKKYIRHIKRKDPDNLILIEEYVEGPQYVIEVIVYKEAVFIIAVIKQQITYDKRFIITGYSLQLNLTSDFLQNLQRTVESIVKRLGLQPVLAIWKCGWWKMSGNSLNVIPAFRAEA